MPDSDLTHAVRLGANWYLVKPGSYRRRPAPMFGARFTTGDPDWNNLSMWQHWVQRTWIGGFDASEWQDEAMYDKAVGIDTSYPEILLLARDLGPNGVGGERSTDNWDLDGNVRIHEFFIWNGVDNTGRSDLYVLTHNNAGGNAYLHRWVNSTTDWTLVHTFTSMEVKSVAEWRRRMYFGTNGANLTIMAGEPGSETFSTVAKPAGVTDLPYMMKGFRERLYVGFGNDIWRMKPDGSWDGSTVFYEAAGVDFLVSADEHLGFLYMASNNGHILRTDGNNTFDMWKMESGSVPHSIRSFDGRLFIATQDPLEGTDASEAVLYQFSGAAVTELKRFGDPGVEMNLGRLRAIGGRLMFGAPSLMGFEDGFGLTMYDPVEDSYHIFASSRQVASQYPGGTEQKNWIVDDVIWTRDYLWCAVRGYGVFRARYQVRDVERELAVYHNDPDGTPEAPQNTGFLESSEFDAGTPGLLKLWNAIIVDADLPSTDTLIYIDYSLDGGETWVLAQMIEKTGAATRYRVVIPLDAQNGGIYNTTFKYRVRLRTTDDTKSPAVRGIIVRYLPVPEPSWMWDMTLVLSEDQELLDGSAQSPNNVTKLAALDDAYRDQQLIFFEDIDGTRWADNDTGNDLPGVLIHSMERRVPIVTANASGHDDIESEINITLLEAIEHYENEV